MVSEEIKKELDEYNQGKNANYQTNSNKMANLHEQDQGDTDPLENPEPDLDNYHTENSYHMQD